MCPAQGPFLWGRFVCCVRLRNGHTDLSNGYLLHIGDRSPVWILWRTSECDLRPRWTSCVWEWQPVPNIAASYRPYSFIHCTVAWRQSLSTRMLSISWKPSVIYTKCKLKLWFLKGHFYHFFLWMTYTITLKHRLTKPFSLLNAFPATVIISGALWPKRPMFR